MDIDYSESLAQRRSRLLLAQPRLAELEQRLLALGGARVLFRPEPDLELILDHGRTFGEQSLLVRGLPGNCHRNAAVLWATTLGDTCAVGATSIVRGWGLRHDTWYQHSWLMHGDFLIETTEERTAYFGVELEDHEAEIFHDAVIPEFTAAFFEPSLIDSTRL